MGRRKASKLSQDHREPETDTLLHPSSEGIGKKTSDSEFEDFQVKEVKRNFMVYDLSSEETRIVFDWKTRTVSIEIGDIFSLSQGNQDPKIMHALADQLKNFPKKERETVLAAKGIKKRKGRRKK